MREQESRDLVEVANISHLTVRHARGYIGLEKCRGLKFLVLVGCADSGIPSLKYHPSLAQFSVTDSAVRDIGGVEVGRKIYRMDLSRNFLEDLSPLLECPRLRSVDVSGNPLSDTAYHDVLPELDRRGVNVLAPTLQQRDLMLRMRSVGLPFAYYRMGDSYRLSRPGLDLTDMPEADHIKIGPGELSRLIESEHETLAAIFERRDLIPTWENP
ncbi:hypothetical protein ACFXI8_26750 [Streptomyces niveus]|uniref:hypothetical protein n=1 Tax=Streptomyces niveus TaxID=193462 RepID=UPI003699048D